MRASLTRLFTGDEAEAAIFAAAGVNDRDHNTMPPIKPRYIRYDDQSRSGEAHLYEIWNSGRAW